MADYREKANAKLMEAITKLKESNGQDKTAEQQITEELINNAQFMMPVMITDEESDDRKLLYGVTAMQDGHPFYMLFTSKQKLKTWNKEGRNIKTVTHNFEEVTDIAVGDSRIFGLVINPGEDNFIIARRTIADLRTRIKGTEMGLEGESSTADEDVTFQDLRDDEVTKELQEALIKAMGEDKNIIKGYFRDMMRKGHLDYVVIIDHIGSMDEVFPKIMECCKKHSQGRAVALLSAKAPVAGRAIDGVEPIYTNF